MIITLSELILYPICSQCIPQTSPTKSSSVPFLFIQLHAFVCVCSLNLLLIIPYRQKCTLQEPFTDLLQLPENATITHAGSDCALVKYLLLFFYFNHFVLSCHLMIFPLLYARRAVMLCFLKSIIKSHTHLSDVPQCLFTLLSAASPQ